MLAILPRGQLQDLVRAVVEPDRYPHRSGKYVQGAGDGVERGLRFAGLSYVRDDELRQRFRLQGAIRTF
jgi:hypothetical protein